MKNYIVAQLIIAAHQFMEFGDQEYEEIFETLLRRLQKVTGTSREQAVDLVVAELSL